MRKNQKNTIVYWVAHNKESDYIIDSTIAPTLAVCQDKFDEIKHNFIGIEHKIEFILIRVNILEVEGAAVSYMCEATNGLG